MERRFQFNSVCNFGHIHDPNDNGRELFWKVYLVGWGVRTLITAFFPALKRLAYYGLNPMRCLNKPVKGSGDEIRPIAVEAAQNLLCNHINCEKISRNRWFFWVKSMRNRNINYTVSHRRQWKCETIHRCLERIGKAGIYQSSSQICSSAAITMNSCSWNMEFKTCLQVISSDYDWRWKRNIIENLKNHLWKRATANCPDEDLPKESRRELGAVLGDLSPGINKIWLQEQDLATDIQAGDLRPGSKQGNLVIDTTPLLWAFAPVIQSPQARRQRDQTARETAWERPRERLHSACSLLSLSLSPVIPAAWSCCCYLRKKCDLSG